MKLKLGILAIIVVVAGCSSSTIVNPPPPCSSTLPSGTLTVACTPPAVPDPIGLWSGTLTTEGGSGTQTFTAVIEADGSDFTGVFTVADKTLSVDGNRYTGADGELFTFRSPNSELVPQLTPALYTGLTWLGPVTEATFSGTWEQLKESEVVARGTFRLARQP